MVSPGNLVWICCTAAHTYTNMKKASVQIAVSGMVWLNRKQLVLFLWCKTELYPLIKVVTDTLCFFVPKIYTLTPACQIAVKLVWCGSTGNTSRFFLLQIYHCHLCLCVHACVYVWVHVCSCICVRVCVQVIQAWSCVSKYTCVFTSNNDSHSSLHGWPKVTEMNSYECMI